MAGKLPAANAQTLLEASPAEPSAHPPVSTVSTVSTCSATSTTPLLPSSSSAAPSVTTVSTVSTVSTIAQEGSKGRGKAGNAQMGLVPIDKINWNLLPVSPEQRRQQAFTAVEGMATPSSSQGGDSLKKKSRGNGEMEN